MGGEIQWMDNQEFQNKKYGMNHNNFLFIQVKLVMQALNIHSLQLIKVYMVQAKMKKDNQDLAIKLKLKFLKK